VDIGGYWLRAGGIEKKEEGMNLNEYAAEVHKANAKWWVDLETGKPIKRNVGELLMLCTSELAEAMEGHRKDLQDDKLPHRKMFEVELADTIIRVFDICAGLGLDIDGAYREKMAFNAVREDHQREHRLSANRKKY
jgi:NTP pyrophosphatase (non-canonical NTP hydrolase)